MTERIDLNNVDCVGCGACQNICSANAINMEFNNWGFLYPLIDENKCVFCGNCYSVCQINKSLRCENDNNVKKAYISITKDKKLYKNAASGGIFGTLANCFFEKHNQAYVVGAKYEDGKVSHVIIDKKEDIFSLQNSKYVQSDMGSVFKRIRDILNKNEYLLFCGTPCQVFALRLFLNKEYSNFFAVDLICHGVPSPIFLNKNLKQYGRKIEAVRFRLKKKTRKSRSGFILSFIADGKKRYVLSNRDLYYSLFMKNMTFRGSCYNCKFANLSRIGDITIGDCDSHSLYKNFHKKEATSTVIINNKKGNDLWEDNKDCFDYYPLDIDKEAALNSQLSKPSPKPSNWHEIMNNIRTESFEDIQKKYCKANDLKAKFLVLKNLI